MEQLANGSELVHVALPLSEATSIAWPVLAGDSVQVAHQSTGPLTLVADLEAALAAQPGAAAPSLVVTVGGAGFAEVRAVLDRVLAGRVPEPLPQPVRGEPRAGGVERRLGEPGQDARLRLEVALPPFGDPRRSALEVLVELLPELLRGELPGLRSGVDDELALLELPVDAALAELTLSRLRAALARVSAEGRLAAPAVERAQARLRVRRQAQLERHPAAAVTLAEKWLRGGATAVREHLFGLEGVTRETVHDAAREWLPLHPPTAVITLPPTVLNPRFAPPPTTLHLANNVAVVMLERPAITLSAVSLRPVLVPDVGGELAATILARLASELRGDERTPAWIEVRRHPPAVEVAAPADGFDELCEVLAQALQRLASDRQPVGSTDTSARGRALQLMGQLLALSEADQLSPASLLAPGNLALGAVVPDTEAAGEALAKLLTGWGVTEEPLSSQALAPEQRTREATTGETAVMVVAVPLPESAGASGREVVAELLLARVAVGLPSGEAEVLRPLLPGRHLGLLVVSVTGRLDELERELRKRWGTCTSRVAEAELAPLRHRIAARQVAEASGTLGAARACASAAAGDGAWRSPAELELEALSVTATDATAALAAVADWKQLVTAGAGPLPIGADKGRR